ncbi:MAG: DUF669 domain-containing protein [Phycisphaeraceae bacterium]|nr:DUF669 domain-containing protein [Phycisphaeraceae bacterium]MCB9848771.1 DUF669 domain-containing protein [Phycisphaeraceae bacterium]
MATLHFNANEVDPATPFEAIPAGTYAAIISESEMKTTKTGNGKYLQLTLQVTEGAHRGRLLWARLNIENPSETAVQIARSELSAICRAVGVMAPRDSIELHNIPLRIHVACKKRDDTGEIANEIKGYESQRGAAPAAAAATPGSTPPWKR